MQTLRDWRPGDNIFEALHHEEPVLAIRELQAESSGIGARLQELTGQAWRPGGRQIAKIVNEGPADEEENIRQDYTDCRYWVQLQIIEGTEFRGNPLFSEDTTNAAHQSPGEVIAPNLLTAVNLAEWDADSHTLPVDGTEYVVLEGWWDTGLNPDGEGDGTSPDAQFTLHWFIDRPPPSAILRCKVKDVANIYTQKKMSVVKWDGTTESGAQFLVRAIFGHAVNDEVFAIPSGNGTDVADVDWMEMLVLDPKQNSRYQVVQLADTVGRPTINSALIEG